MSTGRAEPAAGGAAWNRDLVRSRFFDAISLLLPAAEAFLIDTLGQWLATAECDLPDWQRDEVRRFLEEEQAHQHVHRRYNSALVSVRPSVQATAERADRLADGIAALATTEKMALAAAFEHLTAVLSREVLTRRHFLADGQSWQARVWRWHAREELDHQHVTLIATAHMRLRPGVRVAAYVAATVYLLGDLASLWRALCRCDVDSGASRAALAWQFLRFSCGSLPSIGRMAAAWAGYLLPWSAERLIRARVAALSRTTAGPTTSNVARR